MACTFASIAATPAKSIIPMYVSIERESLLCYCDVFQLFNIDNICTCYILSAAASWRTEELTWRRSYCYQYWSPSAAYHLLMLRVVMRWAQIAVHVACQYHGGYFLTQGVMFIHNQLGLLTLDIQIMWSLTSKGYAMLCYALSPSNRMECGRIEKQLCSGWSLSFVQSVNIPLIRNHE